jgi:large subunit ribosomal protein L21e
LKEGDRVSVIKELSEKSGFPERLQGRTGVVTGKKGKAYIVEIRDKNKLKKYIIKPIHLKKIRG